MMDEEMTAPNEPKAQLEAVALDCKVRGTVAWALDWATRNCTDEAIARLNSRAAVQTLAEQVRKQNDALRVTLGNIRSLKHAAGIGVVVYDAWEQSIIDAIAPNVELTGAKPVGGASDSAQG